MGYHFLFFLGEDASRVGFYHTGSQAKKELRNRLRLERTTLSQGSQLPPGESVHEDGPLGEIGCPDGDVIALVQSKGQQPLGNGICSITVVLVSLADGERVAKFRITRIDDGFLGSKLIGSTI